jgi:hypothetical protein
MIEKFRPEFEEHMERARAARPDVGPPLGAPELASAGHSGFDPIA